MLGLGALIFGALLGGSAIRCGIDNVKSMSKPYRYLDDGTPVYLDRKGKEHINGEKVIGKWNYELGRAQQVGERSGRVYMDPEIESRKRMDRQNEERRQEAISQGKAAYMKYDCDRKIQITAEVSTRKFIAELEGREDGTYWMYYLSPNMKSWQVHRRTEGDPGVRITQEYFDKLNIYLGTHMAIDRNRTNMQYYAHIGDMNLYNI